jgi:F-type H+-transporting ATPase subunit c
MGPTSRVVRRSYLMDLLGLSLPLGLGIAALGSGLGLGKAVAGAMEAMGRQPEAIGQIQTAMIIGLAFIEALTIYALLSVLLLMGKLA